MKYGAIWGEQTVRRVDEAEGVGGGPPDDEQVAAIASGEPIDDGECETRDFSRVAPQHKVRVRWGT